MATTRPAETRENHCRAVIGQLKGVPPVLRADWLSGAGLGWRSVPLGLPPPRGWSAKKAPHFRPSYRRHKGRYRAAAFTVIE